MNTIKTIMLYDWLQLKRSKSFWILTMVFAVISVYAALYGRKEVAEQQRKIGLLQHAIDSQMHLLRHDLTLHDSVAWEYEPLYKAGIYNTPDGIAALAFGQRDLHKFAIEISEGTFYYNKYATGYTNKTLSSEINNPLKQLAGHLDMAFVITYLMPLYLILLSYNLLSGEKERGTLPVLEIQSGSLQQLFFAKLFVRWLIVGLVSVGMLLLAALLTGSFNDARIILFTCTIIAYSLMWAGILSLIASFQQSSGFNAISTITAWLFFCLLLPAAFNAFLNAKYSPDGKIALSAAVREANAAVFSMPRMTVADSFYQLHPAYNNLPGDTLPGGWYNPRWMRSVHAVLDNKVRRVEQHYHRSLLTRMQHASVLNYFSPALLTQDILTKTAASDAKQLYAFDTACWYFFVRWNDSLDDKTFFHNNRFTLSDIENLPIADFHPYINWKACVFGISLLLIFAICLFVGSYRML